MNSRSKTVDVNSLFNDVGESKAELAELTKYGAESKYAEPFRGEKLLGWIDRSKGIRPTVEPMKDPKIEEKSSPKSVPCRTKDPVREPKQQVDEQPSTSSQPPPTRPPRRPEAAVIDFVSNVDAQPHNGHMYDSSDEEDEENECEMEDDCPTPIRYKCEFPSCDKSYLSTSGLKRHKITHISDGALKCPKKDCDRIFAFNADYQRHLRKHSGEKPFKCEKCPMTFERSHGLTEHMRKHTGEKPYQCPLCEYKCSYATRLHKHNRAKHQGETPAELLTRKRYPCIFSGCNKVFFYQAELQVHEKTHVGEKPFKCDQCESAFANSSLLRHHKRNHENAVEIRCEYCDFKSHRKDEIKHHLLRAHPVEYANREKTFICPLKWCKKAFASSAGMKNHVRSHSDQRKTTVYKCQHCTTFFPNPSSLLAHQQLHENGQLPRPIIANVQISAMDDSKPEPKTENDLLFE